MSIWYEIKDKDDIEISEDGKTLDVNFTGDHNGNIYVEIPIEFIKEKLVKSSLGDVSLDDQSEATVCPDCSSINITVWSDGEMTCYDCRKHWETVL